MAAYLRRGGFFQYFGFLLFIAFFGLLTYGEALAPTSILPAEGKESGLTVELPEVDLSSRRMMSAFPGKDLSNGYVPKLREFILEGKKTAYLTFDDGPSEVTGQILDILKDRGIKATFFVIGTQAEQNPAILKRIHEEGHTIGNHTYSHRMAEIYQSSQAFLDSIVKNEQVIARIVGGSTPLVRAPGGTAGRFTLEYYRLLDSADYIAHDWNVDSRDSLGGKMSASTIVEQVLSQTASKERAVILMHDGSGKENSAKALGPIIDGLQQQGFVLAPLSTKVFPYQASIKK